MALTRIYNPEAGIMKVIGLMSGSGSNLRKIIEHGKRIESQSGEAPYHVAAIFSDNPASNAEKIGKEYDIPVVLRDLVWFYKERGKPRRDLSVRAEFDQGTVEALREFNCTVAAYAGYMSIATAPLINAFLGVNVHPSDLSLIDGEKRRYTGDQVVRDAILAGEEYLRASTHIIEPQVDYGRILMISSPLLVNLPPDFNPQDTDLVKRIAGEHQDRLKERGDWVIFPKTLEYLAKGRYSQDEDKKLYFDERRIPQGVRLDK